MTFASFVLASALGAANPAAAAPVVAAPAAPPAVVAPAQVLSAPVVSAPVLSAPAPVVSAPSSGCCGSVAPAPAPVSDCGCGSEKPSKHGKSGLFGGLFSKKAKAADCGCETVTCEPAKPAPCAPAPVPCTPAPVECAPAPCDPCATPSKHGKGGGFFSGLFGGKKKSAPAADCGCGSSSVVEAAPSAVITPAAPVHAPSAPVYAPSAPVYAPAAPVYHGTPTPLPASVMPAAPATPAAPAPVVPIKKLPSGGVEKKIGAAPAAPTITPAAAKAETGTSNPFDLDRRYDSRVAHATDYSSLTGQLTYVHADGGLWVLRYAGLGTEDANGGSVILARDRRMADFREGDLVTVKGRIIDKKGSSRLGAPLFQANDIHLVERPAN